MNCEFCDKSFSTKNYLIVHLFEVHGVKLECKLNANKSIELHSVIDCCSLCGESHETESCVTFLTLQIVSDTFTLSRARLTLPQGLSVHDRVDGSTAVIANVEFRIGVRFGPFKARTSTTLSPKVNFPLKLFDADASWDDDKGCVMYTDLYLETDDEHMCNWMCLIGPAGSADEQNLLCFQMKQDLYYLVIKDVNVGDELKVWYAPYYAKRMSSTTLIQPGPMSSDVQVSVCDSPGILDSNTDERCCIPEASCGAPPAVKLMPVHGDSKADYGKTDAIPCVNFNSDPEKNCLWTECVDSGSNVVKKRPLAGHKKFSKISTEPVLHNSYVLCFDSSVPNSGNSGNSVFKIRCVTVNDDDKSWNLNPDHTKFSPLLLGATELKEKWKCNLCDNVEYTVASHAKHVMQHYRKDEIDERTCFAQRCPCGILLKTRKKLEHHRKVCSQMVDDNENMLKKNGRVDVKDDVRNGVVPICPIGDVNSLTEQCKNTVNNVVQLQQQGPGSIPDFSVVMDNNFALINSYCKETDFQCFSITETLKSIEEGRNEKEADHKILDNVRDTGNHVDILLRSCAAVDGHKLESNEQAKVIGGSTLGVKESDCLLNVENIPPILDLTDDEVIVFQSIKNFTQSDNSEVGGKNVPGNNGKTLVTSVDFDSLKDSCQVKVSSVDIVDCGHNYSVDFHDSNLMQESFSFGDLRAGRSTDPFNDGANEKFTVNDSNHYSMDKSDSLNSLLNGAPTGLVDENCLSYDNEIALLKVDKSVIGCGTEISADLKDKVNNSISEQFQGHQLPLEKVIPCDGSNSFVMGEIYGGFSEKENSTNSMVSLPVKSFLCDICGKKFSKSMYLRRHLRKHTGEFCCLSCMVVFARKENLSNHVCSSRRNVLRLLKQSGRRCNLCGKLFKSKTQFKEHQASCSISTSSVFESDANKVACIYCGKICDGLNDLKVHTDECLKRFTEVEPIKRQFLCDKCGLLCISKRCLNIHLRTHGERSFFCPICRKKFNRKDVLQNHLVTHQSVGPSYECPVCDKKLKTKKSLYTHLKIHTGSKRFKCDQCSKAFYQKVNLTKHLDSHAHKRHQKSSKTGPISNKNGDTNLLTCGDDVDKIRTIAIAVDINETTSENGVSAPIHRTFKCNICAQIFLEERRLKIHIKRVHVESGNFVCKFCNTVLKHKPSLTRHIKRRHPTEKTVSVYDIDSSASAVGTNYKKDQMISFINPIAEISARQCLETASSKTETVNKETDPEQSSSVFIFETNKVVSSDFSKSVPAITAADAPSAIDKNSAADRTNQLTDYLYYILTPSSQMPDVVNNSNEEFDIA